MASPVSASWKAWRVSCSSKALRSEVSRNTITAPEGAKPPTTGDAVVVTGNCDSVQAGGSAVVGGDVAPQGHGPQGRLAQELRRLHGRHHGALVTGVQAVPAEHAGPRRVHERDPAVLADGTHTFTDAAGDERQSLPLLADLTVELGVGQGDGADWLKPVPASRKRSSVVERLGPAVPAPPRRARACGRRSASAPRNTPRPGRSAGERDVRASAAAHWPRPTRPPASLRRPWSGSRRGSHRRGHAGGPGHGRRRSARCSAHAGREGAARQAGGTSGCGPGATRRGGRC